MKITKKLFDYLDMFVFVDDIEVLGAICDYFRLDCPSYEELSRAWQITDTYKEYLRIRNTQTIDWGILKKYNFTN